MDEKEVLDLIALGESSRVQFKESVHNAVSIAQEIVALLNTKGGKILIGVSDKTQEVVGLSPQEIHRINMLLANATSDHVKPPVYVLTENIRISDKTVIVVNVEEGTFKPYRDKDGIIFVKNGSDKRKVVSNEETARLLQAGGQIYAEERLLLNSSLADIDQYLFTQFYEKKYNEELTGGIQSRHIENLRLGAEGKINVAGALLFGKNNEHLISEFSIVAIWFWGNDIASDTYRSSENMYGNLASLYRRGYDFLLSKLDKVPNGRSFNSLGEPEIPPIVLTELLVNALIHRDYFIKDSIKVYVFDDRIEIKSPGKLPNNLTEEQIRRGIRRTRNTIVASFASDIMEYRGAGSGVLRALSAYPHIDFKNDVEGEQFTATIFRKRSA